MAKPRRSRSARRVIIGLAGAMGAGKTTAGQFFHQHKGFAYLRYSKVLADWLGEESVGDKSSLQEFGWLVMSSGRQPQLNRKLISKVKSRGNHVIDGLRHPIDHRSLRRAFGRDFYLVFIDTPRKQRWMRKEIQSRFPSYSAFLKADAHPVEQRIRRLKAQAFRTIRNIGTLGELERKLQVTLQEIQSRGGK